METEISYKKVDSFLDKNEKNQWILKICTKEETTILLSEEKQEYLKDTFNILINQMIDEPFCVIFHESNLDESKGLNEICEKYISILNNDLKGVYEDFSKNIFEFEKKEDK